MDFWQELFSGDGFVPRRFCGDWNGGLIWLHVVSDSVIFLAYLWIPLTMFVAFRRQGNKLVLPRATWLLISLYIAFIAACGFTHFFDALMFWNPVYRANGVIRALTAVISIWTAASLSRLIPLAVTAPIAINAQQRLVKQQQDWLRDILDSATGGVLRLRPSASDLPEPISETPQEVSVTTAKGLGVLRRSLLQQATEAGFSSERKGDFVTATHEAAMNALRHAGHGTVRIFRQGDTLQVWIVDAGQGIPLDKLPIATLKQGYSTAGTAGQGWFLMLSSVDAAYLCTGLTGTTIVLQMSRTVPEPTIPISQWAGGDVATPIPFNEPVLA
ncbi:MAG: ATP-binding protein [Akkermansiaceae bacterium]|nr:ATP-binding protein [Armatimonadota bacterium]